MTHEEFEALVRRLEGVAREHPGRYRRRVVGLGLLGYAYVATGVAGWMAASCPDAASAPEPPPPPGPFVLSTPRDRVP